MPLENFKIWLITTKITENDRTYDDSVRVRTSTKTIKVSSLKKRLSWMVQFFAHSHQRTDLKKVKHSDRVLTFGVRRTSVPFSRVYVERETNRDTGLCSVKETRESLKGVNIILLYDIDGRSRFIYSYLTHFLHSTYSSTLR